MKHNITPLSAALALLLTSVTTLGQPRTSHDGVGQGVVLHSGYITQLRFPTQGVVVPFRTEKGMQGPTCYVREGERDTVLLWQEVTGVPHTFEARYGNVVCQLNYATKQEVTTLRVLLRNEGHVPFQPTAMGLWLGVDTYMDAYPAWLNKFFPTLLRCEPTFFYGYLQSPHGQRLALVSDNALASWSLQYNKGYQDPPPHWFMGHRVEGVRLDLLHTLPLPSHHPQHLWQLAAGEERVWQLQLVAPGDEPLAQCLHRVAGVPLMEMERINWDVGSEAHFTVHAHQPHITVIHEQGEAVPVEVTSEGKDKWRVSCKLPTVGRYIVEVKDGKHRSEGSLTAHVSWQWCMEQARKAALIHHQKPTSHAESWYGFYSAFLAAHHFPQSGVDSVLDKRFERLFALLHHSTPLRPRYVPWRIQNTATTIGLLVARYEAYHRMEDLERAAALADWLIRTSQRKDGAYMSGHTVYTSVIYVAKSLMELQAVEATLPTVEWQKRAKRHLTSVRRAVDQLVKAQGNLETEGQLTYEDGMVSCSALQIGQYALTLPQGRARQHYTEAMLQLLKGHNCLTQLEVNDARQRGGTLRFWEAQYDVMMLPNMLNSPHGWSAWRTYATYYAYLLTGDREWLVQTYNALGAMAQLLDTKTGVLRWAFVVDPYVVARQTAVPHPTITADSVSLGNPHPDLLPTQQWVVGEQYIPMVSHWQGINTQDNDVHEVFKCMAETVLTQAFIVEREDGEVEAFNCKVERQGNTLNVTPLEPQVRRLHCNLQHSFTVRFASTQRTLPSQYCDWWEQ